MIVSDSARVLFVHVQKTGGLTVQDLLRQALPDAAPVQGLGGGRHARLGAALKVRPELRDYFIFGFVRNPWARMWSWYSMVQRRRDAVESGNEFIAEKLGRNPFWAKVMADYSDFETFVLQGSEEVKRLRTPQVRYLRGQGRKADFIGGPSRSSPTYARSSAASGSRCPTSSRTTTPARPTTTAGTTRRSPATGSPSCSPTT